MINGAHMILYSKDAEADRAFFREVLKFDWIDVHAGWLIFKLPPSEAAIHPSDDGGTHELYLMTDDLEGGDHRAEREGRRLRRAHAAGLGPGDAP